MIRVIQPLDGNLIVKQLVISISWGLSATTWELNNLMIYKQANNAII